MEINKIIELWENRKEQAFANINSKDISTKLIANTVVKY